jgi:hypothetical protein
LLRHRILFDYDAFQIDTSGRLVFARPLSLHPEMSGRVVDVRNFCVDLLEKKDGKQHMAAVFCSPKPMSFVKEDMLNLNLENGAADIVKNKSLILILVLLFLKL